MDDFVRCASLLASPITDPSLRGQADAWLTAFRCDHAAWAVALAVLRTTAAPPEVRLQAASLLAWKVKRQLGQLQSVEAQAELAEALTGLAAAEVAPGQPRDLAVRGVCVALANLAIQCSGWARPLDTLGLRLSRERMIDFLTLLPQECEDAAAAAQSASAELAWSLKTRAHQWSPEVAAWLHTVHSSSSGGSGGNGGAGGSPGAGPPSPDQQLHPAAAAAAAAAAGQQQLALTLSVLRCFGAWVKWGALQYVDHRHASYFASLAAQLLFLPDAARGLPYHPLCLPAAVDASTEIVEHATDALQPLLLQLAVALPARVAALHAAGAEAAAEELCHVYALFCSTHCALCTGDGPHGRALRQGLLQLLALPLDADGDTGAALPAMGALSDLLEHMMGLSRGDGDEEEETEGGAARPMDIVARRHFASAVLDVLLVQLQPYDSAFQPPGPAAYASSPNSAPGAAAAAGTHSPEGAPDALRREAGLLVIDLCGELLGAEALVGKLVAHAEHAVLQLGVHSVGAQRALDVSLFALEAASSWLESCCSDRSRDDPAPAWLEGVLRLYSLVPEVDGSRQAGAAELALPPTTILHADFLSSFRVLAHLVMPLLQPGQQQQALVELVLGQALRALSSPCKAHDVTPGSTNNVVQLAAYALRVLCSSATAAGLPTSQQLLAGVERGMALLQQPHQQHQQHQQHQKALSELVTALVHALHGIPPGTPQLRGRGEAAVQRHVFAPLTAALQELQSLSAAVAAEAESAAQHARGALGRLVAALHHFQALLNGLESYTGLESRDGGLAAHEVGRSVAQAAGDTFLSCWPQLAEVCSWRQLGGASGGRQPGASLASLQRELHQEVAHCVSSCITLDEAAFKPALPSFAQAAAECFFQPGAAVLHAPLILAITRYGGLPQYQQPLLSTVAALLAAPPAQQLAAVRGGDADPEAAEALLSLVASCLRQARQWQQVAQPAAVEAVLQLGLPLAVANAACHHKDASQRAVGVLTALLALALAADSPLHAAMLGFVQQQGPLLLQGMLLALLSLNSASHLPKVVSLMSEVALLAATLAMAQQQRQEGGGSSSTSAEALCAAASSQLGSWMAAARVALTHSGILSPEAMQALLAHWDWQPVLQQAVLQVLQQEQQRKGGSSGGGACGGNNSSSCCGGGGMTEVRRSMQRSVRQLADMIRRCNSKGPAV